MQSAWLSALVFLAVSTLAGGGILVVARLLRVRTEKASEFARRTYECGEEAGSAAWMQFHARYYVVALFFVIFDVEAIFSLPWSIVRHELGAGAFAAAVAFVLVLLLGWLYAIRKEALKWQ